MRQMFGRLLPPLNSLRAFEAAARHQSLSRAADELSVTHGAVSRQVAKLEKFLGTKLFERRNQQVLLTKRGASYAAHLQSLFDQMHDVTLAHFDPGRRRGTLHIGVLSTFAIRFLIPRLAHFKQQFPDLVLRVDSAHNPINPNDTDADVAIWLGQGDWPGLAAEHLFDEELIAVASPELLKKNPVKTADDIQPLLLLHALQRLTDWPRWLKAAGATKVDGRSGLKLEYSGLVYQGAIDGLGVAVAQTMFVQEDLAQKRLARMLDVSLNTGRAYYLVYSRTRSVQPAIAQFAKWIKSEIAETTAAMKDVSGQR